MLFAKAPQATCFYSRLLPDFFDTKALEARVAPIRVADFGPAMGETIKFLSQFSCRLRIVDCAGALKALNQRLHDAEEMSDEDIGALLTEALNLEADDCFDLCLFWDTFSYLDSRVLPIFAQVLSPHLTADFRGHGFAVLTKSTTLNEQNYGIINMELLSVNNQQRSTLPHKHSQAAIREQMKIITVKQSVLRDDGRLEMILTRT